MGRLFSLNAPNPGLIPGSMSDMVFFSNHVFFVCFGFYFGPHLLVLSDNSVLRITPGRAQETLCGARDQTCVSHMQGTVLSPTSINIQFLG